MAKIRKKIKAAVPHEVDWPFGPKNYFLFAVALVVIIVGYICLGWGNDPNHPITLTIAPILLVVGYLIIPFAIMAKGKSGPEDLDEEIPWADVQETGSDDPK